MSDSDMEVGDLDMLALLAFLSAGDWIVTWYDQSGVGAK